MAERGQGAVVKGPAGHSRRRRPSRRVRRNRTVAAFVVLLVLVGVLSWAHLNQRRVVTHPVTPTTFEPGKAKTHPAGFIPVVEAGLLPWGLAAPLSRMVVEPSVASQLTILGGYDGNASAAGVYDLDTTNGGLKLVGDLAIPTHDAAGAVIGGRDVIFGGGDVNSDAEVQALTPGPGKPTAAAIGLLPDSRSDCFAVSIGGSVYVVGGYDGSSGDPTVLATTDGRSFTSVATLALPVRYPAVAALGGNIYVIGGEAVGGADNGTAVRDIQVVNPLTGSARILGSIPEPLEGASAVTIDGHIYVAGGSTTSSGTTTAISSTPTIWAFDPLTGKMLHAGTLRVAVSNAGIAVIGTTAWLVGGETDGAPTSAVQMFHPDPSLGAAGVTGEGSP